MQTKINQSVPGLITAGRDAVRAALAHGVEINLVHLKAEVIEAVVNKLVTAQENHRKSKVTLSEKRAELKELFKKNREYMIIVRGALIPALGKDPSDLWALAGFPSKSHALPRSATEMEPRLETMEKFFTDNPAYEVAAWNVTAAEVDVQYNKIVNAREAVREAQANVTGKIALRREAEAEMYATLGDLRKELSRLIEPMDVIWKTFGFNLPGASATPDAPQNLVVMLIGNNEVSLKWKAAPRAEYYRVWKRVLGVEDEFVAVGSPADVDFTLQNLPSTSQVELAVSAVNNGGESPKSAIVKVTTL